MPIVHILLGKANPNRANGVNKVVNELARSQHHLGEQVAVWGITPSPEAPTVARCYPIRFFQAHRNPFIVDGQLIKALHEVNPTTVFHLHGGFIPAFFALHKWLVRLNLRFIFTPHGSYNHAALSKSRLRKTLYFNCFERSMVNHAKALHLIGKSELESSHQLPITAAKVLVPNGQNLEDLQFKFEAIGSTEGPVFSFCGRFKTK
ncbi:MAG: glycosyltransferase [Salibacteraceae bacterium]